MCYAVAIAIADVCSYDFYSIQPAYKTLLNWATAYAEVCSSSCCGP